MHYRRYTIWHDVTGSYRNAPARPRIGDLEGPIQAAGYAGVRVARHNHAALVGLAMDEVADWYLIHAGRLLHGDGRSLLAAEPAAALA